MAGLRDADAGARQVGFEDGRRGVSRSVGHRPGIQHQGSAATRKSRAVAAPRSARFPREQLSVQVNCPRFFMKRGYGQGYRVKRSRRAGFVASAIDCPLWGRRKADHFCLMAPSRTRFPAKTPCLNFGETFVSRPKQNLEHVSPAQIVSHFVTLGCCKV